MSEDNMHFVGAERAELETQVAAHPFLIGINESHIRLLADCAMRSQFTAGEIIFRPRRDRVILIAAPFRQPAHEPHGQSAHLILLQLHLLRRDAPQRSRRSVSSPEAIAGCVSTSFSSPRTSTG